MTPELRALQDLCAKLESAGIEYMLTGSLAASYYASPRMTRDIDIVVSLEVAAASKLAEVFGTEYHADTELIAEGFRLMRPCNVIHLPTLVKIDLIPRKDGEYRRLEFQRRRKVDFAGVLLWIVSPEDLVLSKLEWARESRSEMQLRDVRGLLGTSLDRAYLNEWAGRLGVAALLKEATGD
ncbi:MAG: hypothetical protein IT513_12735 [Burkholderiales bacterium]|nr:hypothetical protein [Burkholderiales bacterium]